MKSGRLLLPAVLLASSLNAQQPVPLGSEFQVSIGTGTTPSAAVAADASGNFVVVWHQDGHRDGSGAVVLARRYDAAGAPIGPPFQVNTYTTSDQRWPVVAMNAAGAFVVGWTSFGQDGHRDGGFAQLYDAAGAPAGPEFQVSTATLYAQGTGAAGMAEDGTFVITWGGDIQGGAYSGAYGRRFDTLGNSLGPDFDLPNGHMVMNPAGEFVVVWRRSYGSDITARRFDPSGQPAGPEIAVDVPVVPPVNVGHPAMGIDGSARFVVAWTRGLNLAANVVARVFDAAGPATGEFVVHTYTTGTQQWPAVGMRPEGDFVVVWESLGQDGSREGLFGRAFDAAGVAAGPEFPVNTFTTGQQRSASVAMLPDGGFVVVWTNALAGGRDGIFARRFAVRSDLIFADGFESGDFSAWSLAQTDGGDLQVTAEAAMAGTSFGLRAVVDDTAGIFVLDDSPQQEGRYRARFLFDPTGYDPGEAAAHHRTHVFLAFAEAPLRRLVQVILRRQGGVYALGARVRLDDNTLADAGFTTISAAPHVVEIHWQRATAAGTNDGRFEMWIDGTPAGTLAALDNDERPIDFVRLGAMSVKSGANGTLAFDEFESRRFTYIGP